MRKRSEVGAAPSAKNAAEDETMASYGAIKPGDETGFVEAPRNERPVTLKATWGEEKLCLAPYSTTTVGPFELEVTTTELDVAKVFDQMNRTLAEMAERERERKVRSFLVKMEQSSQKVQR